MVLLVVYITMNLIVVRTIEYLFPCTNMNLSKCRIPTPRGGANNDYTCSEFEKVPREQAYSLVNEIRTFHFSL
jgi:hypothetical protein